MGTQITLHAFTLTLLGDVDARAEFQADPEGCLEAAGLSDLSVADVHEILPLVLDSASVVQVEALDEVLVEAGDLTAADGLKLVTGTVESVTDAADVAAAPSAITALVTDFGGVGDVSNTLDVTVLTAGDAVTDVTAAADVAGVADVHDATDALVKDIGTDVDVKDVVDSDVLVRHAVDAVDVDVKDVANLSHDVVQGVAQVGDVHHEVGQVVGDVNVGDIHVLDGGVGNNNDIDVHF
jgi:hypothetical protein